MAEITEKTENCERVAICDRLVAVDNIEPLIKVIRGQQVMLDRDLATLYGVETKRLNEQVKRNIKRFPEDFMFQLTKEECLRSQIATLNAGRGQFYGENRFCIQPLRSNGILVRENAGFHGQVVQNQNLSGRTRGRVSRTDTDCGLTDKLGLRFTDRHSLDFPDTRHLNFPDASYLTKQPKSGTTELPSQMARGGLTALGTRGRGPRSGRAWSAPSHSETVRGETTTTTPGRLFCGKTSGQLSPRRLLSNISSDIPSTNRNQQQLDFVRRKGVFYGQT